MEYKCPYCGETFKKERKLYKHIGSSKECFNQHQARAVKSKIEEQKPFVFRWINNFLQHNYEMKTFSLINITLVLPDNGGFIFIFCIIGLGFSIEKYKGVDDED